MGRMGERKGPSLAFRGAFRGKQMWRADCGQALTVNISDLKVEKYYAFKQSSLD